jgi:hypothetical protein
VKQKIPKAKSKKPGRNQRTALTLQPTGPLQTPIAAAERFARLAVLPKNEPGKKVVLLQIGSGDVAACDALITAGHGKRPLDAKVLEQALPVLQSIVKGWLLG